MEESNPNLLAVFEQIGQDFVQELQNELRSMDKVATGNLIDSLDYRVIETADGYEVDIIADDYLIYVDQGRRPGKRPPSNKIIPWVQARGIKMKGKNDKFLSEEQVAFLIAKSIGENGVKPTDIIRQVKDKILQKYANEIAQAYGKDVENQIRNLLSDI